LSLSQLYAPIADDMKALDGVIRDRLYSDVVLIRQVAEYIIGSGGKRMRPAMVLFAAGAAGYQGKRHLELAAVIEFIHTATLLHDDVVDESDCGAATRPPMPCSATPPRFWWATSCIPVPSR
jgi:octaprenyl-diphosphate synthase